MSEATQTHPIAATRTNVEIEYWVAMPYPESHLFEITLQVRGWSSGRLDLKMPVWTPGSYLIREYARHMQDFTVVNYPATSWQKVSKNHWQIYSPGLADITVRYRVFANELTVRTNHLDSTHGYFNPAALCLYVPGFEHLPIHLTIVPPHPEWQVTTPLPRLAGQLNTFVAQNFDELVDSPFEVGCHGSYAFEVLGKPHELAVWGQGNLDPHQAIQDIQKIIQVEAELFNGLPYDRYVFLLHLSSQGYGGLEHKTSCTLNYSRFGFHTVERYNRFMQLVAHEFFHLWNVKRIRPKGLETFDYAQENYTPSLWFSEGTTSYYDVLLPYRAGIYTGKAFLKELSKEITRYLTIPGRYVQPLAESSADAWIKLYRRDANSDNSQMSYYLKGAMVSLLLDLLIRARHQNQRSMDDVLRQMWQQFGQPEIGFTPDQLETVIESVAGTDLSAFFHHCLHTVEDLPFDTYLEPFGLRLQSEDLSNASPFTGMAVKAEHGRDMVKFVEYGGPAQRSGIDAGDELLAMNGIRVTTEQLADRLKDYRPGEKVQFTLFHQDELRTCVVELAAPRPTTYQLVVSDRPSVTQQRNLEGWLGVSLSTLTA